MAEQEPFKLPERIEIMAPQPTHPPRGRNAGHRANNPVAVRYNDLELNTAREAAKVLGMNLSDYLRWVALFTGQEVLRLHNIHTRYKRKPKE